MDFLLTFNFFSSNHLLASIFTRNFVWTYRWNSHNRFAIIFTFKRSHFCLGFSRNFTGILVLITEIFVNLQYLGTKRTFHIHFHAQTWSFLPWFFTKFHWNSRFDYGNFRQLTISRDTTDLPHSLSRSIGDVFDGTICLSS